MDTHDRKVIDILGDQKRFIVPFYQRHYKWEDNLWLSFWEDVRSKAEEKLAGNLKFAHYMGALILSPESVNVAVTPRLLIVDGQQRITTFQLFLSALKEAAEELEHSDIGESVQDYLFNKPKSGDKGDDVRFKLAPNRADRKIFYMLVGDGLGAVRTEKPDWFFKNGGVKKKYASNTVRALIFFKKYIKQFSVSGYIEEDSTGEDTGQPALPVDDDHELIGQRLEALLEALLSHLKLVVITLGDDDDAQVIFETLNSKNEPLTAMELVRNFIFQRAAADSDATEELFEDRWKPLEEQFWNETAPRARPSRPRIDHYLGHTLTAQTGVETSLKELYAEYRAFSRAKGYPRFSSVEEELDALLKFVPVYRGLEGEENDADLLWLGEKLALWEITTAYSVVFVVAVADVNQQEKRQIYELLNSYLVRRMICGLTPKNLNKNFQRIVSILLEKGVSLKNFIDTFDSQEGDSVRFPSDAEFRSAIRERPLYSQIHRKERLQEILWNIETVMRDKYHVNTARPQGISIEHVLPQTWYQNWELPNGKFVRETDPALADLPYDDETQGYISRRQTLKHTLGNLTLITVEGNTKASNSAFAQKKIWLKKSLLAMNVHITNHAKWNEETIEERSAMLADLAVDVWPASKISADMI